MHGQTPQPTNEAQKGEKEITMTKVKKSKQSHVATNVIPSKQIQPLVYETVGSKKQLKATKKKAKGRLENNMG